LVKKPTIVVGTPGRLVDHFDRLTFDLANINALVLDEFDKSLEFGFHDEMQYLINKLPNLKRKTLTSATLGVKIPDFLAIQNLHRLNFGIDSFESKLEIKLVVSPQRDKLVTLLQLICNMGTAQCIVFCNHRDAGDRVVQYLSNEGVFCTLFHGGMDQKDREFSLMKFKNGSAQILVATDLAARGLDIPDIEHIVHYHLPHKHEEFVHRNGRTARMHNEGNSYILKGPDEELPQYVKSDVTPFGLAKNKPLPDMPKVATMYIGGGKKNKINKVDVVGFISQKAMLTKDELGLVVVRDNVSYAAVPALRIDEILDVLKEEKIKGKKLKIGRA
jgi:superfamily II DNA/RNA helicase